jgi:hypothetical protein
MIGTNRKMPIEYKSFAKRKDGNFRGWAKSGAEWKRRREPNWVLMLGKRA